MKNHYLPLLCSALGLLLSTCTSEKAPHAPGEQVLFQVSTIDALLAGDYDGTFTFGELRKNGDFGVGTFNGLDGELLALDGHYYQIRSDGKAYPVPDSARTPFATVVHFEADTVFSLDRPLRFEQLLAYVDSLIPTENLFYAIRVEGYFGAVKTRSVPRQEKPYRPLVEVVKNQPTFDFTQTQGTLAGFRTPPFMKGLNVPGYHLHFLTHDRTQGGHVLACTLGKVKVSIDYIAGFQMILPTTGTFHRIDLSQDKQDELEQVEKQRDQ
ncbi:alpha-acetolactate decarboxylase [Rhabdobacter roseus]|uniref:Alpha-acetolactate decarboxylase n=1 Tax=Rhabdobacter roseus TaxID=1655419 RepID=A0A840TYF4_9BACT|nr:acetolactate decarboxylase [Rhabdobacter roseus]MBB5285228.1 acetolactate decarboxylase [Rhabdobacter roseus]